MKVVFPVTQGSATVILRPEHGPDGSLVLVSSGDGFGGPGFYRVHRDSLEQAWRAEAADDLKTLSSANSRIESSSTAR